MAQIGDQDGQLRMSFCLEEVLKTFARFDLCRFDYPREDGWALPWETMQFLGRLVEVLKPQRVIEFGSGLSTVVLAALLQQHGGRLLSFEHSATFARQTAEGLRRAGLATAARLACRGMTFHRYGSKILPVYRILREDFDQFIPCEVAVIDGPPGHIGREAVLYELFPRLAVGARVVMDDARRPDEQHWLKSWQSVFGEALEVQVFPQIGRGLGLLHKRSNGKARYRFPWREVAESWRKCSNAVQDRTRHA